MNKQTLILLGIGVAIGYFCADQLTDLNKGKNPFTTVAEKGASFAL